MNEYITAILTLMGIILAVFLMVFILKKMMPSRLTSHRSLKIIEQLSLGSKERIVLLNVQGELILLGVSAHNVSTLHVCKNPTEPGLYPQPQDTAVNRPKIR